MGVSALSREFSLGGPEKTATQKHSYMQTQYIKHEEHSQKKKEWFTQDRQKQVWLFSSSSQQTEATRDGCVSSVSR
jgi:hypothetical protein